MQSRESGLANVGGHCQGRPVFELCKRTCTFHISCRIQLWLNFLWTRISIQFHMTVTDPVHIIFYMDKDTNCMVAAGRSCTWDLSSSHYINAGLQNGSLLAFDMRQTVGPVNSLKGLTRNPVHMADSLLHSSTLTSSVSSVPSASSICLSQ